ncbi:acyl-CoA dehydratase activase-related protein [Halanaerobacter jeridensis]|uniref:Nucleotide-binding protein (Sugar kinase/HSP70/actin superfamily) n=1 Tax=Halanaerobacter jeridensis TaxID=706427 RepID=A0A939BLZ2_9FIRM|nr:acyl-CoA dehydratase activase-related protein [Halanaerobacter jeridensis]MBM7555275.1 putative nucleotide-binding protein (sugar kinase/HSP70/actin superfamily) [Halanaerobacter jeridensis]
MSKIKIGLPRALLYHRYYEGWETFFESLDCEIVKAKSSTKYILDRGVKVAEEEACLPVKLFLGHVEYLKDKSDYIFVPRLVSVEKNKYLCPKFLGLPEMVKSSITGLPKLIDVTIDLRDRKSNLLKVALEITQQLNKSYYQSLKAFVQGYLAFKRSIQYPSNRQKQRGQYKVGILGHEYIVYDDYINMGLINKLKELGVRAVTTEMLDKRELKSGLSQVSKDMFWTFSERMLGTAYHFFENNEIDGIIQLTAFGCGSDSLVGEMIAREARDKTDLPFMSLNLDEHTGEAGLITRLEAFIDMLKWRDN